MRTRCCLHILSLFSISSPPLSSLPSSCRPALSTAYCLFKLLHRHSRPSSSAGSRYIAWLKEATATLRASKGIIQEDAESYLQVIRSALPLLGQVSPLAMLAPYAWVLGSYFRDPRLVALLSFQVLYVGLSPKFAPGVVSPCHSRSYSGSHLESMLLA